MSFAAVLILAVSLSMDALGIGISYGLRGIRVSWKARVVICAMSMMVTGAAVGLGSVLLEVIPLPAAKLLGCGMLLILGLVIIVQGFRKRKEENSFSCDFDRSKAIETAEALYLGAALSVDSFGAGVSSAVSGMNSILVPILAGLMQMLPLGRRLFREKAEADPAEKSRRFRLSFRRPSGGPGGAAVVFLIPAVPRGVLRFRGAFSGDRSPFTFMPA